MASPDTSATPLEILILGGPLHLLMIGAMVIAAAWTLFRAPKGWGEKVVLFLPPGIGIVGAIKLYRAQHWFDHPLRALPEGSLFNEAAYVRAMTSESLQLLGLSLVSSFVIIMALNHHQKKAMLLRHRPQA